MKKEFHFFRQGQLVCMLFFISSTLWAQQVEEQWMAQRTIEEPRINPYHLEPDQFQEAKKLGQWHTQYYPVETTGILPPLRPIKKNFRQRFS